MVWLLCGYTKGMTTTETAPLTINTEDHWTWINDLITEAEAETPAAPAPTYPPRVNPAFMRTSTGFAIPQAPNTTTEATEAPVVRCARCHRPLTSTKSIAAGQGRTCTKRTRQEAAGAGIKPATVAKAQELIEQGGIVPLRGRRVFEVVSSDGSATYKTAPQACTCPAGIKGRHVCYHRVAAILLAA